MPLYEYTCLDCNESFDALRKFAEADDTIACLHCESENTVRGLSTFAVHGSSSTRSEPIQQTTTNGGGCCSGGGCACGI